MSDGEYSDILDMSPPSSPVGPIIDWDFIHGNINNIINASHFDEIDEDDISTVCFTIHSPDSAYNTHQPNIESDVLSVTSSSSTILFQGSNNGP